MIKLLMIYRQSHKVSHGGRTEVRSYCFFFFFFVWLYLPFHERPKLWVSPGLWVSQDHNVFSKYFMCSKSLFSHHFTCFFVRKFYSANLNSLYKDFYDSWVVLTDFLFHNTIWVHGTDQPVKMILIYRSVVLYSDFCGTLIVYMREKSHLLII